jgi:hypothetical protein
MGLKLHIIKSLTGLRQLEDNKSLFHGIYSLEYNKNAPEYDKNGNKENFTLGVVAFSERILKFISTVEVTI